MVPVTHRRSPARVLFVLEWMPAYRIEFLASLHEELRARGHSLTVAHGNPTSAMARRGDARSPRSALYRPNRSIQVGRRALIWQPWRDEALRSDLVVVNEGSRLLLNYWLIAQQLRDRSRVAFWGHGANLDALNQSRLAETVKRGLYRLPHWWFAYTEGSKQRIVELGFPADRITVVQNAIPTESLQRQIEAVREHGVESLRTELGLDSGPLGLFLGSLYPSKRLEFLLEAADRVAAARSDFSLVIAGDGPDREKLAADVASRSHVRMVGRVDGERKALLLKAADVLLVPGAVGLNVLDGFAAGIPIISTAAQTHGPEIEYVENGANGQILPAGAFPADYAAAVLELFNDPTLLTRLQHGASQSARAFTCGAMVRRFADGIEGALAAPANKR